MINFCLLRIFLRARLLQFLFVELQTFYLKLSVKDQIELCQIFDILIVYSDWITLLDDELLWTYLHCFNFINHLYNKLFKTFLAFVDVKLDTVWVLYVDVHVAEFLSFCCSHSKAQYIKVMRVQNNLFKDQEVDVLFLRRWHCVCEFYELLLHCSCFVSLQNVISNLVSKLLRQV